MTVPLEDLWDEPAAPLRATDTDLRRIQGTWGTVAGRRPARFFVSGSHLTVHFADGDIYMGAFTLAEGTRPKAMDVRIEEGPDHHRGLTAHCIYELDGDTLRWCTATPGRAERPSAFDEHNPQLLCLILRREHRAVAQ
jgi:uncharacterized protein (TIGR03067 family)